MLKEVRKPSLTIFVKNVVNSAHSKTSQQIFVLMKTSFVFVLRRRLEDVLIKTNMFALDLRLQKSSSRRLGQDQYIRLGHTSSRRLQDVFKTSSRRLAKRSSRHLQDVFKTSSRRLEKRLQDIFKTFWRRLQDFL